MAFSYSTRSAASSALADRVAVSTWPAMVALFNSIAFAAALTALLAFRFRVRHRAWLAAYFLFFACLEAVVQTLWLPEGAIPPATALVLFGIAGLFTLGTVVLRRLERAAGEDPG